jgi:hypothetical protein
MDPPAIKPHFFSGLQLQEVDLPDEFDVEIANTQTQLQDGMGWNGMEPQKKNGSKKRFKSYELIEFNG